MHLVQLIASIIGIGWEVGRRGGRPHIHPIIELMKLQYQQSAYIYYGSTPRQPCRREPDRQHGVRAAMHISCSIVSAHGEPEGPSWHHVLGGPRLGRLADAESDGQSNGDATADGPDDDGIYFNELLVPGTTAAIEVHSSVGGGRLDYFFDFDGDN